VSKGTTVLKATISPKPLRYAGVVIPFRLAVESLNLSHPLTEAAVRQVAEQLLGGYGSDAVPLAMRYADAVFEQGDPVRFSDWCRLILAIELIQQESNPAKRQRG
jgi:hypothetical protein